MPRTRAAVLAAASALVLCGAAWGGPPTPDARATFAAAERVRLRAHFDSVDAELRARDLSRLAPAQRAARTRLIAWLRDYRDAGAFPANDLADHAVPIFRDSRGTLCAMAYLIDRSGRGDIVDRVARTRDTAYIAALVDDTALVAWLDRAGLDVAEAARIQPTYGGGKPLYEPNDRDDGGYVTAAIVTSVASLATIGANLESPRRATGVLGLIVGGGAVALGAAKLGADRTSTKSLAAVTTSLGAITLATAVRSLIVSRPARPDAHDLAIAPAMIDGPRASRLGLVLHARF